MKQITHIHEKKSILIYMFKSVKQQNFIRLNKMETETSLPYANILHKKRKRYFISDCNRSGLNLPDYVDEEDDFGDDTQFEILNVIYSKLNL